jgi:hypothetical protein
MADRFGGQFAPAITGRGQYLRPTGVQPRMYAGQNIAIQVVGLRDAQRIPAQLQAAFQKMLIRLENQIQAACRAVVPGGPTGTLGRQVHARVVSGGGVSNRIVIGTIGSDFARSLNRGFTSTPKTAKALRFNEGGKVYFRMRARVSGKRFFEKWLVITPPIVEAVYDHSFYNIKSVL